MKRLTSLTLAVVMLLTFLCPSFTASAEQTISDKGAECQVGENNLKLSGTNSFGSMLSDAISNELNEQEENNGCNIFSVEVTNKTATVSFETIQDCTLVVAVYEEDGVAMLATGNIDVTPHDKQINVEIDTESMPEYFYLRAFLVDSETFRPLCSSYETPNYTREMQEFFSKTTADFDEDKVLNFDESETNNFAVYNDSTIIIENDGIHNVVTTADEENNLYIIENINESLSSLKVGDVFAYNYSDNDILIIKIETISINGNTAVITSDDAEMNEIFEFVRIDSTAGTGEAVIDTSTLGEGVEYIGTSDVPDSVDFTEKSYSSKTGTHSSGWDLEGSAKMALNFNIEAENLSGSVGLSTELSVKVYITFTQQYIELLVNNSINAEVKIKAKIAEKKIPLSRVGFSPVAGVYVEYTPSIIFEATASVTLSGELTSTVGFRVTGKGIKDMSTTPHFQPKIEIAGTFFVGLSLEPKISIIDDKVVKVSMEAKAGVEIKGKQSFDIGKKEDDRIHLCSDCIDGDISGKVSLSFKAKLFNSKYLSFELEILDFSVKFMDFYISNTYREFDFTTCPHYKYKVTVNVKDLTLNPLKGAIVQNEYATDKNGRTSFFLNTGTHTITASKDGYLNSQKTIKIKDEPVYVGFNFIKDFMNEVNSDNTDSENPNDNKPDSDNTDSENQNDIDSDTDFNIGVFPVSTVSLGEHHSACITENGDLYTWGWNDNGELGNGTTEDSYAPTKIMGNVKQVSLGCWHSACITENGDLYTWGLNDNGQLGNGTTEDSHIPTKIMENVKQVSLGNRNSACITENGDLYTWGWNDNGELGNGTTEYSSTPIKIMENVKQVSLGYTHSACITQSGDLYTWGFNMYGGQLGNGTTEDSYTPTKIMENVKQVSFGLCYSACITENGDLYTWGWNFRAQLGNGTCENSYVPIKIMENVKQVSLGHYHSACITENGDLYTWGYNDYGQLGNVTTENYSITPIKIMENIKQVSLGAYHSACITQSDDLYAWGLNCDGQLGNGTTENSYTPIKITRNAKTPFVSQNEASSIQSFDFTESTSNILGNIYEPTTNENGCSTFTDLIPNGVYNFYSMKNKDSETPFNADNLLYITQATADPNGELSVTYKQDEEDENADIFVVSDELISIEGAKIESADMPYNGEEQFVNPVVTLNGKKLVFGEDYILEGTFSATETGEYTALVRGIGFYTGTIEFNYTIYCAHEFEDGKCTICGEDEETVTCIYGDVNGDGRVTAMDAFLLQRSVVGYYTLNKYEKLIADINGDGRINTIDCLDILRYTIGYSTENMTGEFVEVPKCYFE